MTTKTYRAWIIAPTGRETKFKIALESILMPNHYEVVRKSWADKRGARAAIERGGYGKFEIVDAAPFDLVPVNQAARDAYRRQSNLRRDAVLTWSDTPMAQRLRVLADEEDEMNLHILGAKMSRIVTLAVGLAR
jgi:hypothetical protein